MKNLVFADGAFGRLKEDLLHSNLETCAVLLTTVVPTNVGHRMLVNNAFLPNKEDYAIQTAHSVQLRAEYLAPIVKRARQGGDGLVFVHTHPFTQLPPAFSVIDDDGEKLLSTFLFRRGLLGPHVAVVLSEGGICARELASDNPVKVIQVGTDVRVLFDPDMPIGYEEMFDRQVRAFGHDGQASLKRLTIGIVGLGGTGSIVAQQLAYLGVEKFLLIDPDTIEESNLNRLPGATLSDIGSPKLDLGERIIRTIRPAAIIEKCQGSVLLASIAKQLAGTDFVFCCTDSHGSRAVLGQFAYQYIVPCIDMGVSITSKQDTVSHITGRVQMLAPGLGCLTCAGLLDPDTVRRDLMTVYERQADPYFLGDPQPQPAVISFNMTVASLAVTMFLGSVTNIPAKARYQIYSGITGNVRAVAGPRDPLCIVCSKRGALGRGDTWPLPARQA